MPRQPRPRARFVLRAAVSVLVLGGPVLASPQATVDPSTVDSVLAAAQPGDVITFESGTYNDVSITFDPAQDGAQGQRITLRASPIGSVTFTGSSSLTVKGDWLVVDGFRWEGVRTKTVVNISGSNHCVFSNNALVDAGPDPTESTGSLKIQHGSTHNLITRNRFENLPAQGVQFYCWSTNCANPYNTLSYNHFLDKKDALGNNGESIQYGQGGTGQTASNVVEHNLFENIGQSAELVSNKTDDNTFRHNTLRNIDDGLVLRSGKNARVHGNWFFDTRGIRVHESGHDIYNNYLEGNARADDTAIRISSGGPTCSHKPVTNVRIAHNTIVQPAAQGLYLGSGNDYVHNGCTWSVPPTDLEIANNVIVASTGTAIYDRASASVTWSGNVVWPTGSATAGYSGSGVTTADPELAPEGGVLRLQATSTALIGQGSAPLFVSEDIFGRARHTTQPTIGAEEWDGGLPAYRPLTAADVGPGSTTTFPLVPPGADASVPSDGGAAMDGAADPDGGSGGDADASLDGGSGGDADASLDAGDPAGDADARPPTGDDAGSSSSSGIQGGCSCWISGHRASTSPLSALPLVLVLFLLRSRTRRRRTPRR